MHQSTTDVDAGWLYYRHTDIVAGRPTILFIHGLGESGLCFLEAFHESLLRGFNIVVPDLLGFGKSTPAREHKYEFSLQISRACTLLDRIGVEKVHLVGHSMGGDIGTLFCQQESDRVLSFVNVEGNLTPKDRTITDKAIAAEAVGRFEEWLRKEFPLGDVLEWCHRWPSCVRYPASLNMCQSQAFLASVQQMHEPDEVLPNSDVLPIGETYRQLPTPRVYCWGSDSLSEESQTFLAHSTLEHQAFFKSFHWVMLDQPVQFYSFLSGFLKGRASAG
ncbi:MAG: alpha/beta hydrolase [Planctomycetes bacterium]|nr:alpha/beta hydrolase [Planctomycetota bacterium]